MTGQVVQSTGSWYIVKTNKGELFRCRLKGKFRTKGWKYTNPVAVGDYVVFQDQKDDTAVICQIAQRSNVIIRKATRLSRQTHIIAANVDQGLLVASLAPPVTSTGFIDRFLVTMEAYEVPAKIVINKSDLYQPQQMELANELKNVYQDAGYPVLITSIYCKNSLNELKAMIHNKLTALAGHSGVGKTALLNAIEPGLKLKTGDISKVHNKGKHTTTFARMLELEGNARVVDTPGIKEYGLFDLNKNELRMFFPEMMKVGKKCKYYDCTHIQEPQCAVKKAVEEREIAQFRYKNYTNMLKGEDMNFNPWELK